MSTETKKDVIYIDIEDDITSVIGKVKGAKTPIVALVPPKRIGVLQSVVNLKLLQRAATTAKKRVVLITNDQALTGLAASLALPVAKNLQSKPEVPTLTAVKLDDDEVIDGEELPVGELEKTADKPLELTGFPVPGEPGALVAATPFAAKAAGRAPRKGSKVPNFDAFRKKLFIFGGIGALVIIFLIWAVFFAGKATVAITAKTNIVNINKALELRSGVKLDAAQGIAPAVVKEIKRSSAVEFTATGKKDVGEKATGTVKYSNSSISSASIPAGTELTTSGGLIFVTDSQVTVPAPIIGECSGQACIVKGSATGTVHAAASGSRYNGATGSLSGSPSGVTASFADATTGGTDKTVSVVSQNDIDLAKEKLQTQDANTLKAELQKQFAKSVVVINESFTAEPGDPTSTPGLDQEATSAKLTAETVYRMVGIARSDLRTIYDTYTKSQIDGNKSQKIYESGDEVTSFAQFAKTENGFGVKAQAAAQVGPNIDDRALASQLVGKRSGEIQQQIEAIQGVEDVQVKFSPFWVTKAPQKADKITIKFVVKHD